MKELSNIAEGFMEIYPEMMDGYENVAKICSAKCASLLRANGIKGITSHRVKSEESLRGKLADRISDGHSYLVLEDIPNDIIDLAGVRVSLYFPTDQDAVAELISANFQIIGEPIAHPDPFEKRGGKPYKSEYRAIHFRVKIYGKELDADLLARGYDKKIIEIQVATLMMHAWSEVEHDLSYKPKFGILSDQEIEALNQLNALVTASELSLRQLSRGGQARAAGSGHPLENHYELANHILSYAKDKGFKLPSTIGHVDELLSFLRMGGKDTPQQINKYIESISKMQYTNMMTVSELIIQEIINENSLLDENRPLARQDIGRWRLSEVSPGSLIKATSLPMLYWYGRDRKRYVIPTINTYLTWFPLDVERPSVHQLSDAEVVSIPIGGNVTYRPGVKNIKIASSSNKYAVSHGGQLHLINDHHAAVQLFGENWEDKVDTIPDVFFTNYFIGHEIKSVDDFNPIQERDFATSIDDDKGIK